jgi:hypothetical protein
VIGRSQFEGDRGDEQPQQGGVVTFAPFETAVAEVLVGFRCELIAGSMAAS